MTVDLRLGDCIEVMATLEAESVSAIVTDPPYGLSFMGKDWDSLGRQREYVERGGYGDKGILSGYGRGGKQEDRARFHRRQNEAMQAWHKAWSREALRILKPGGHLLAFGGTRTYHRLACGLEDAGFEIRDSIAWLYGSGFPKSLNLDGDADGWGTALKPAHEQIVVARKSMVGTVAANFAEHGTGALNIDACRLTWGVDGDKSATRKTAGYSDAAKAALGSEHRAEQGMTGEVVGTDSSAGRWPANVVLDEEAAMQLDEQTGIAEPKPGRSGKRGGKGFGFFDDAKSAGHDGVWPADPGGGASRFFYCAKASRAERNAGLENFDASITIRTPMAGRGQGGLKCRLCGKWKASGSPCVCASPDFEKVDFDRPATVNQHPTVKPISLMRWLVRLVAPLDGLILDPFLGSGTTGIAAVLEDFPFIGIEQDAEYLKIAEARIAFWQEHGEDGLRIVALRDAANQTRADVARAGQLDLLAET